MYVRCKCGCVATVTRVSLIADERRDDGGRITIDERRIEWCGRSACQPTLLDLAQARSAT